MDKEFVHESVGKQSVSTGKLMDSSEWKYHIKQHLYDVREMIDNHIEQIHTSITENVKQTIKYIQNAQKSNKHFSKRPTGNREMVKLDPSLFAMRQLWDQVASPDASIESPLQMISVKRKESRNVPFKPRITVGEEVALRAVRLTKGERIDNNIMLPSREVVQVDSRIDRFKRQNGITVNDYIFHCFLHKTNSHALLHCKHKCTKIHFFLVCIIICKLFVCKYVSWVELSALHMPHIHTHKHAQTHHFHFIKNRSWISVLI